MELHTPETTTLSAKYYEETKKPMNKPQDDDICDNRTSHSYMDLHLPLTSHLSPTADGLSLPLYPGHQPPVSSPQLLVLNT